VLLNILIVAPATVTLLVVPVKPVNPEYVAPVLNVKVPVVLVTVPVPLKVPDNVTLLGIVGLAPKGRVQFEFTVLVPV